MPDKDKSEFTVTDRRLFSAEGELRKDVAESEERSSEAFRPQAGGDGEPAAQEVSSHAVPIPAEEQFTPPSEHEQAAQAEAYKQTTKAVDDTIRKEMRKQGQPHRPEDFEITFDKFIASLYMSTLMQLGLAAPEGTKPQVDIIGARQTIDTLSMLREKTKGNLTPAEENVLQNILYELRMAYLEVMNLITKPPTGPDSHKAS